VAACPPGTLQAGDDPATKRVALAGPYDDIIGSELGPPLAFPLAALQEAKTRDSRCCSSLRVVDLYEFFATVQHDRHVMADVIGEGLRYCGKRRQVTRCCAVAVTGPLSWRIGGRHIFSSSHGIMPPRIPLEQCQLSPTSAEFRVGN